MVQQFVTYQSKETDLFIDYHPPKSFHFLSAVKYYTIVQQPIGNLVCQIFGGLLNKQIAKNVLVIGSTLGSNVSGGNMGFESLQKTLLIQALAGETEMKIITDNASRYAVVSRGFAIGIKYLKEVFEAITLNTPCLFLLEDIHLIGERRPLLISDHGDSIGGGSSSSGSDLSKTAEATFGSQRNGDAMHEKNQIYYQLSRHGITHYKKPFKGDFSLAIPSNHFAFDLFLKPRQKSVNSTTHPLAFQIDVFGPNQNISDGGLRAQSSSGNSTSKFSTNGHSKNNLYKSKLINSRLNLKTSGFDTNTGRNTGMQSGSPFSVLLLKEQKKLKANKIVNELPWVGLPSEQLAILPRVSYSVRAKVSALAELGFSNMSAKLDMITDLLVIIDSVRGHRGFVVFATTHLPHILDPALRRPGRLDETISIPTLSNLWTRWEFSKYNTTNRINKSGFAQTSVFTGWDQRTGPENLFYYQKANNSSNGTFNSFEFFNLTHRTGQTATVKTNMVSPAAAIINGLLQRNRYVGNHSKNSRPCPALACRKFIPFNTQNQTQGSSSKHTVAPPCLSLALSMVSPGTAVGLYPALAGMDRDKDREALLTSQTVENKTNVHIPYGTASKLQSTVSHIAYYQIGKKIITNKSVFTLANATPIYLNMVQLKLGRDQNLNVLKQKNLTTLNIFTEANDAILLYGPESLKYKSIYGSTLNFKNILIGLMAGKFAEYFAFNNLPIYKTKDQLKNIVDVACPCPKSIGSPAINYKPSINFLYGIDQTWRAATTFAFSLLQKRYLFNKNLIVPKLLNFLDYSSLEEPASPPSSNILIPAKRYENAKKSLKQSIQVKLWGMGPSLLNEKLQAHTKQAYIKNIYSKKPLGLMKNQHVNQKIRQQSNLLSLTSNDVNKILLIQPTSASSIYKRNLLNRHRLSLNNQWWNGQLTEHSAESLFLSDIDWRYTFIPGENTATASSGTAVRLMPAKAGYRQAHLSNLPEKKGKKSLSLAGLTSTNGFHKFGDSLDKTTHANLTQNEPSDQKFFTKEILIDFPDADQHYNPKHRRWFITSGYWDSWFNIDKQKQADILNHLILESVVHSYFILNTNRELLDYSVSKFLKKGLLK